MLYKIRVIVIIIIITDKKIVDMKATTIAHLVGKMDVLLEWIEINVSQIEAKDYRTEYLVELLMGQINKAKDVNEEIFEKHQENEHDKIKSICNGESK